MRPLTKLKGQTVFFHCKTLFFSYFIYFPYKIDEKPDSFYLILKGKVDILVPKPYEQILLEKGLKSPQKSPLLKKPRIKLYVNNFMPFLITSKKSPPIDILNKSPLHYNPIQSLQSPRRPQTPLQKSPSLNTPDLLTPSLKTVDIKGEMSDFFDEKIFKYYVSRTIEEGFGFGEIPFNNETVRAFTTLCTEDCYLGVIDRKDYLQIFHEINRIKIEEKVDFFKKCFFLNALQKQTWKIYNYSYLFHKRKIKRGLEIFSKGDQANSIFLIKKGEIELYDPDEHVKIALLSKEQLFGEEFVLEITERTYTALCHSQKATIFSLNQRFLQQISIENPEFLAFFKETLTKRKIYRDNKLETIKKQVKTSNTVRNYDLDPKCHSLRATEEDIDRFINAPLAIIPYQSLNESSQVSIKVNVKVFEDKMRKCLFFRGKRIFRENNEIKEKSLYEIDNTEKRTKDRGDDTNFLGEIIRNNQKAYKVLDKRSKKMTRDEILQIFDKQKRETLENRERLKVKYANKHVKTLQSTQLSQLFNETLENQRKKKVRSNSARNFNGLITGFLNRKGDKALERFNEKGEVKVNYHIKGSITKTRPLTGRPNSGGFRVKGGKANEKESFEGVYEKISQFLIEGRTSSMFFKNSDLKKKF